jgi:hypothetical protein
MQLSEAELQLRIQHSLKAFRKTVLGLDKYRINNPGMVAQKYSDVASVCLVAKGSEWQLAVAACEYAGLVFDKYVSIEQGEIDVCSLWIDAAGTLLDIAVAKVRMSQAIHL